MDWQQIANQYGLPLAAFVAFVVAIVTGKLRSGSSEDRKEALMLQQFETERQQLIKNHESERATLIASFDKERAAASAEVLYREQLRVEEKARSERLELALTNQTTALRDLSEVMKDVEREIVRIEPRA